MNKLRVPVFGDQQVPAKLLLVQGDDFADGGGAREPGEQLCHLAGKQLVAGEGDGPAGASAADLVGEQW